MYIKSERLYMLTYANMETCSSLHMYEKLYGTFFTGLHSQQTYTSTTSACLLLYTVSPKQVCFTVHGSHQQGQYKETSK